MRPRVKWNKEFNHNMMFALLLLPAIDLALIFLGKKKEAAILFFLALLLFLAAYLYHFDEPLMVLL